MNVVKSGLSFIMWTVAILLTVGAFLKLFFVDVIVLGHDAMAPTIVRGDQVFMWRDRKPRFNDIAVCEHPNRPSELVVGRVVGSPGREVRSERGGLQVGGRLAPIEIRESLRYPINASGQEGPVRLVAETLANQNHLAFYPDGGVGLRIRPTTVEPGRLYLLGDHRVYVGHDSRAFGTVDQASCKGVAFMIWRPADTSELGIDLGRRFLKILD